MILVYQMAKVGSRSWVEAAKPAAGSDAQPLHCHYIVPANRARIQAVFSRPADYQTIANMLLPRNLLRVGASVWDQVATARQQRQPIRVVCGTRDPVARSISLIMFMADFYGHTTRPFGPRAAMTAGTVIDSLREVWRMVLERREPSETFEWLLWYLIDGFRDWFQDELGAAFDVDILLTPFHLDRSSQRVSTAGADILVYRVEDMHPGAAGYPALLTSAGDFLGTAVPGLPRINTSTTRRSHALSNEVRQRFSLSGEMLDAIYSQPMVRHFYRTEEIRQFIRCWSAKAG